jgi:hypothetical protein
LHARQGPEPSAARAPRAWRRRARRGLGRGADAPGLGDEARAGLRRQALTWLRADLAAYAWLAQRGDAEARAALRQRLAHWQRDADLAPLRDPQALDRLPEVERAACRQLWDDVAALLGRAGSE